MERTVVVICLSHTSHTSISLIPSMAVDCDPPFSDATINFAYVPDDTRRAYQCINVDPTTGVREKNLAHSPYAVRIASVQRDDTDITPDTAGFAFQRAPTKCTDFTSDEYIERDYYPETMELLKSLTGASKVLILITVRHLATKIRNCASDLCPAIRRRRPGIVDDGPTKRQLVPQAHVDQTNKSAVDRVYRHLPQEADALLKKRVQLLNLWRPISHAAFDWPLALCDYRSVDPEKDVFPVALIYPDRESETMGVRYNTNQRWMYHYGMTPEDIVLFKWYVDFPGIHPYGARTDVFVFSYDSVQDGSVALYAPHSAFLDDHAPPGACLRESIEIRALVFYG